MKKLLIAILLLVSVPCFTQQDTTKFSLIQLQDNLYRFSGDTTKNLSEGVVITIPGFVLQAKPLTVNEVLALINYIKAQIQAKQEK